MNYYSHTTDESYREGTETIPYKIERNEKMGSPKSIAKQTFWGEEKQMKQT